MDLNIIKKKDNPLLSRIEIELEAIFFNEPTPKKDDIKKKVSSIEKSNENLVVIKKIHNDFGAAKSNILAYIYKSEEDLKKIEPKKKSVKKTEETKEKPKEAPKEEPKE